MAAASSNLARRPRHQHQASTANEQAALAAKLAQWNSKKWVWVQDASAQAYVTGWIVKQSPGEDEVTVCVEHDNSMRQVSKHDVSPVNPPNFDGADDIADLTYLSEASVVHNLRLRHASNDIYTYSGLFLVAINPYKSLPIYSPAMIKAYKNRRRDENAPHVYAVAERAWQNLIAERHSQSVLVTGESGAGKTENTKKVIQYLAAIAAASSSGGSPAGLGESQIATVDGIEFDRATGKRLGQLQRQILQANPILEAFGNAQTVKNDNSSRFGKFIRVFFTPQGAIGGANIDWYLLEKSRVTTRARTERSFHVFFQLLRGADESLLRDRLLLDSRDARDYGFLSDSNLDVNGIDDKLEWRALREALDTVGFNDSEQLALFRTVAAILHLGNVTLNAPGGAYNPSAPAILGDRAALEKVCFLLGLDLAQLERALVRPRVKAGREVVEQARTSEQVVHELAALARTLYERNFAHVVDRINAALDLPTQSYNFIGVLDIAGFEIFEENSYEQLCINLTNEKLQQFFNHHMFVLEQEQYAAEQIEWSYVNFGLELQPTIDLIESTNPIGILSCLDESCIMPRATDDSFTQKMHDLARGNKDAPSFAKYTPLKLARGFKVKHYAGEVEYRTDGWLDKNRDPLNSNITSLLANSTDSHVAMLFHDYLDDTTSGASLPDGATPSKPRRVQRRGAFRTVAQTHKEQLKALMDQLHSTQPHFIRCIVPNRHKQPGVMDVALVLDQLRCNGVLEGIRIARRGFPNRLPFSEFSRRFKLLAPAGVIPQGFMDGRQACQRILNALELDPACFKIGLTKVFFKAGILAELEERRDAYLTDIFTRVQAASRMFVARRAANKILKRAEALRTLQRNARLYNDLRAWPWWPLFQRVRPLLAAARSEDEMRRKDAELAAAREAAQREAAQREKLESLRNELENARNDAQATLAAERALLQDKDALLTRSKEREAELEDDLALLEKDLAALEDRLAHTTKALEQLDADKAALQGSHDQLSETVLVLRTEQTAWKAREVELASQTVVKRAEWDDMVAKRDQLTGERNALRVDVQQAKEDLTRERERSSASIKSLESRIESLSQDAKASRAQVSTLEKDLAATKSELSKASTELRSLKRTAEDSSGELTKLRADFATASKERDAAASKAADATNQAQSLEITLATVKREVEDATAARKRAEEELANIKSLLAAKSSEHSEQAQLLKMNEEQLGGLRRELSTSKSELSSARRTAADEAARVRSELERMTESQRKASAEAAQLSRKVSDLTARLEAAEALRGELEAKQSAHELELEVARTKAAEQSLKEREHNEREMAKVRSRFQSLEDVATAAKRDCEAARRDVEALRVLLDTEEKRSKELDEQRKALDENVNAQGILLADWERACSDLRDELTKLKAKGEITVVEHYRVLEEAQRLQNAEMRRLEKKEADRQLYVRTIEKANSSLTRQVEDLQHQLEASKREKFVASKPTLDPAADRAMAALERERALRQGDQVNLDRLQSEIRRLADENARLSSEMTGLRKSNAQFERDLSRLAASDPTESILSRRENERVETVQRERERKISNKLSQSDLRNNTVLTSPIRGSPRTYGENRTIGTNGLPASPSRRQRHYE